MIDSDLIPGWDYKSISVLILWSHSKTLKYLERETLYNELSDPYQVVVVVWSIDNPYQNSTFVLRLQVFTYIIITHLKR